MQLALKKQVQSSANRVKSEYSENTRINACKRFSLMLAW